MKVVQYAIVEIWSGCVLSSWDKLEDAEREQHNWETLTDVVELRPVPPDNTVAIERTDLEALVKFAKVARYGAPDEYWELMKRIKETLK